ANRGCHADAHGVAQPTTSPTRRSSDLAGNLTVQLRDVSKVATAIAKGDLTQKITVDVKGEILQIKDVINTMVEQLGSFASEVTRAEEHTAELQTRERLVGRNRLEGNWK